MKRLNVSSVFVIIVLAILLGGCDNEITTVLTYDPYNQDGYPDLRIITFESEERYWNQRQEEILPELLAFVNSGEHNILKVETVYGNSYLISAAVYYNDVEESDVTLDILVSEERYWNGKDDELRPRLISLPENTDRDIVLINTLYLEEYLVVVEVYYSTH